MRGEAAAAGGAAVGGRVGSGDEWPGRPAAAGGCGGGEETSDVPWLAAREASVPPAGRPSGSGAAPRYQAPVPPVMAACSAEER
jgi:hypothetical protein